jgi:hypothetical protein
MAFVIYVNHPTNKAIVHSSTCHKYQHRKRNATHNGYWTRPTATMEEAFLQARATGKRTVDTCAFCC